MVYIPLQTIAARLPVLSWIAPALDLECTGSVQSDVLEVFFNNILTKYKLKLIDVDFMDHPVKPTAIRKVLFIVYG